VGKTSRTGPAKAVAIEVLLMMSFVLVAWRTDGSVSAVFAVLAGIVGAVAAWTIVFVASLFLIVALGRWLARKRFPS
jgi:hypothetical protein